MANVDAGVYRQQCSAFLWHWMLGRVRLRLHRAPGVEHRPGKEFIIGDVRTRLSTNVVLLFRANHNASRSKAAQTGIRTTTNLKMLEESR